VRGGEGPVWAEAEEELWNKLRRQWDAKQTNSRCPTVTATAFGIGPVFPGLTGDHHLPPCPCRPSSLLPSRALLLQLSVLQGPCSPAVFAGAHCAQLSLCLGHNHSRDTRSSPHPQLV
jgi:hypothetical protein